MTCSCALTATPKATFIGITFESRTLNKKKPTSSTFATSKKERVCIAEG